jgi:pimeloyl-ACP methyl ester carboxylesterase
MSAPSLAVSASPWRHVRLLTSDGVRLHARFWPGSAVAGTVSTAARTAEVAYVVGHGFTGSSAAEHVQKIARRLAAGGAAVLSLDFRGHGRSRGWSTLGDTEVHDLAAAVAWLRKQGAARVAVVGWSMGGSIALRYAGLGGDADAVVSISSPGHWYERGTSAMRIVHWVCESALGRVLAVLARGTRLSWRGWPEVPTSPVEVVGGIRVPLLLVHGDADHYFPARHARLLAAAAPAAELWIEPGMGHAETATTPELVDRVDRWVRAAVARDAGPVSGTMSR